MSWEDINKKHPEASKRLAEDPKKFMREFAHNSEVFDPIIEKFASLPESNKPNAFQEGEVVQFPPEEGSSGLSEWNVVKAEKNHYLLERPTLDGDGLFHHALCTEEELQEHNKKEVK